MNVLVIGSGGREHALAWKLAQSPQATQIFVSPGNAGTEWEANSGRCASRNVELSVTDLDGLRTFAQESDIALTVVGPEVPLAMGIVDVFQEANLAVFGPSQAAAQLEASKAFSKAFMDEVGIPTAAFATFTQIDEALAYLDRVEGQVVVKASGLAAGKGVIVCDDLQQARDAVHSIIGDQAFGEAGNEVVIEERMTGPEISVLAVSDGRTIVPLVPARDHKRAFDNDEGPNTGGMGAFAPLADIDNAFLTKVMDEVLQPTIEGMAQNGIPYVGVLYAGLMLTPNGVRVLEFNCRFGDPETQVVLPLLKSDLLSLMLACVEARLADFPVEIYDDACATVVMASPGYPGSYPKGAVISGLGAANALPETVVFHAGTATNDDGMVVTNGGRVLAVSGRGPDTKTALARAYAGVSAIQFAGAQYRSDIGHFSSINKA